MSSIRKTKKMLKRFELDMYPTMPDMLSVKAMLEWLSKDYCIISKEELKRHYNRFYSQSFANTTCLDRQLERGKCQALQEIFGTELFNEGKK